jgi:septum formation protein
MATKHLSNDEVIIAVDTSIGLDDEIIGKAADEEHCRRILNKLSGRTHDVASAIAVRDIEQNRIIIEQTTTAVTFAKLNGKTIDWYISTNEWRGKAGAYAIQGKGSALVTGVCGCYTNVIGISIPTLLHILENI